MALTSALPGRGSRGHLRLHPQVNKFLRPGLYTVEDSDPATWSQNAATLGRGFIRVFGNGSGQHMHRAPTRAPSLPANFKPCGNLLPGFRLEMSPCIGPSSTIITLVVVNLALTAPLSSVTFRLEQKSFGAQTNVPPVVTAPVMGSGTAVGSLRSGLANATAQVVPGWPIQHVGRNSLRQQRNRSRRGRAIHYYRLPINRSSIFGETGGGRGARPGSTARR